ncbi:MAG: GTP-binding protein [Acutalibacteraceae bacterium]
MATIPVYLFLGFLDSGKTKFMHDTLCDRRFQDGDKTLVVLCEEGEEELDTSKYAGGRNVTIVTVENKEDLTKKFLEDSLKKSRAERVMIEYNGMWLLQDLAEVLPRNWQIYQIMMMADSNTFDMYNSNMRQLVYDKISVTELVAFNRCKEGFDKQKLHTIVRAINRRADIIYEYTDGSVENDDIVDPLPFDLNADVVEIKDTDFGLLYLDAMDKPENYDNKTLKFKALVARSNKLPKNAFIGGRFAMTCCVEDIRYVGFYCRWDKADTLKNKGWYTVTAKVRAEKDRMFGGEVGPMFYVTDVVPAEKPQEETVYFS